MAGPSVSCRRGICGEEIDACASNCGRGGNLRSIRLFLVDDHGLVLHDIRMPGLDGLQVLDRLQERYPETKVVMLSGVEDADLASEALRRGARAFLGKGIDPADVAPVLRQVFEGTIVTESLGSPAGASQRA